MYERHVLICSPLLFFVCLAPAQAQQKSLTLESLMTPDEKEAAGIVKLNASEKSALLNWAVRLSERVFSAGQESGRKETVSLLAKSGAGTTNQSYPVGGGHWIKENGDGKIITLEDGSLWEVNIVDQVDTMLWLPISNITVMRAPQPVGDFRYTLINKDDGEKALAKYIGKV